MIWIQRGLLVLTLVFAGLTVWLALEIRSVPLPDQFTLPNGFETPILAMEFPRGTQDLGFIRGLENEDMRRHIFVVQYIDQYFPYAYGGLLASFLATIMIMMMRQYADRRLGALIFIPLLVFTTFTVIQSDFLENERIDRVLSAVITDASSAADSLDRNARSVSVSAWSKWTYISAVIALMSAFLISLKYRVLGGLVGIPVLFLLYARFIDPSGPAIEFMAQAIAVFFLAIPVLAVYFLVLSFRRTEPENESPRQVET
ncbi:MAG: hypothetical protein GC188_10645 [Alphaproteobacteria bacterium]|nr:hypothetical protein [Alphaproteobacteria bacterium]